MQIRLCFLCLVFFFSAYQLQANNDEIFKRYIRNTNCQKDCAVGIRHSLLQKFLDTSSYLFPNKLTNTTWAFIIDFKMHSSQERGHLLNLKTGSVSSYVVAHGINSDPDKDGHATHFSNISGSYQSSLGLYTTAETYYGRFGYSMRLDGQESTNDRARSRAIVMHASRMSDPDYIKQMGFAGFSRGCPATGTLHTKKLINLLKNGNLYYIGQ